MAGFSSPSGQFWRADTPTSPPVGNTPADGHAHPNLPLVRADALIEQLQAAAQVLKNRLADHFQEFGLNEIRYTVMKLVRGSSPHGCSQTDLAEAVQQSESSISTLVERMRADNLIYRLRSKLDRRKRVLILTERGQAVLQHLEKCHSERLEKMLARFAAAEREELSRLLQQFIDHLSPSTESPSAPITGSAPIAAPHMGRINLPQSAHAPQLPDRD